MLKRIFAVLLASVLCLGCFAGAFSVSAGENWQTLYKSFIKNEQFLKLGKYYVSSDAEDYTFALHDLSGDGVPELISYNGEPSEAGSEYNVFGIVDNAVTFLGNAGYRHGSFRIPANQSYYGLYWCNGNMGYYSGVYYTVEDGELKATDVLAEVDEDVYHQIKPQGSAEKDEGRYYLQITDDYQLFSACKLSSQELREFSQEEVFSGSWSEFWKTYGYMTSVDNQEIAKHREINPDEDAKYVSAPKPAAAKETVAKPKTNALKKLLPAAIGVVGGAAVLCAVIVMAMGCLRRKKTKNG